MVYKKVVLWKSHHDVIHEQRQIHLFFQDMLNLEKKKINESNCYVIQEFLNGNLFTRWNNKCWGTLPTDLTIQQVLMESLKSIGGLYSRKRNGWSTLPYYTKITTKIEKLSNSKQQNKGYQMT